MKHLIINAAASLQLYDLLRWLKPRDCITILCIHRVSTDEDFFWPPIWPETFKMLMEYCRKHYSIIPLSAVGTPAKALEKRRLVLSFDDGYKDFTETALPIMHRYDAWSNHNVVTECADENKTIWTQKLNHIFNVLKDTGYSGTLNLPGKAIRFQGAGTDWRGIYTEVIQTLLNTDVEVRQGVLQDWRQTLSLDDIEYDMMSWDDIIYCSNNMVEIGSQTRTHESLPNIQSEAQLQSELVGSKTRIEQKLGKPCDTIALPNGTYNDAVLSACADAGYKKIMLLNDKLECTIPGARPMIINRINMVREPIHHTQLRVELFHRPHRLFKK